MKRENITKSALKVLAGITAKEAEKTAEGRWPGCVGLLHQPKRPVQKEKM